LICDYFQLIVIALDILNFDLQNKYKKILENFSTKYIWYSIVCQVFEILFGKHFVGVLKFYF